MARGPRYNLPFRRKREGRTDYKKRIRLVLSRIPRLVIRPTNKHIIVQLIEAKPEGDLILVSSSSSDLKKRYKWKAGCGNLPAAYLTGLMAGYKAIQKGSKRAVLDMGLHISSKGSRIYAALKGVLDAGIEVPHGEGILPDEDRIKGRHISEYAKKLSDDPELYNKHFSDYVSGGFDPKQLPEHFDDIKEKIVQEISKVKAEA